MRDLNRINLGGLRAIEAVGRLGGLRAAAEELGVTVGAVSQQIQKTERQLGRALFERRPKGLVLTDHGEAVVARLTSGFSELAAAVALAGREREDTLTVSVAPVFAGKWLVWRLQDFNERHPGIRIRVEADVAVVDPNTSDVDVCIRVGPGPYPGVNATKLVDRLVFPVCSPALADRITEPRDLAAVPVIRDIYSMFLWDAWLAANGLDAAILGDGPAFSDASLCLDAAVAGQGVFLAWDALAQDALAMGRLVAPLPGRHPAGDAYWFITGRHAPKSKSVRAFETWLRGEMRAGNRPENI
jgi:DNA-binding transcriptional LysR family regulator